MLHELVKQKRFICSRSLSYIYTMTMSLTARYNKAQCKWHLWEWHCTWSQQWIREWYPFFRLLVHEMTMWIHRSCNMSQKYWRFWYYTSSIWLKTTTNPYNSTCSTMQENVHFWIFTSLHDHRDVSLFFKQSKTFKSLPL